MCCPKRRAAANAGQAAWGPPSGGPFGRREGGHCSRRGGGQCRGPPRFIRALFGWNYKTATDEELGNVDHETWPAEKQSSYKDLDEAHKHNSGSESDEEDLPVEEMKNTTDKPSLPPRYSQAVKN